ncbi:MAG: flagellin [Chlamydiales bacterium]|jgi:flagellin
MAISPIGSQRKASLFSMVMKKQKKGNRPGDLLSNDLNAKLLQQIASSNPGRTRRPSPSILAIADSLDSAATRNNIGAQNAEFGAIKSATADAALQNASDITNRLGELAIRSSDSTLNDGDRAGLNAEAQALKQELSDMQSRTTFNSTPILQGSSTSTFTGEGSITTTDADLTQVNSDFASFDISTQAGADAAIASAETAQTSLMKERVTNGSNQNRFERESDFARTVAISKQRSAEVIRTGEMGTFGSLFGPELSGAVNELMGFSF